jgi:DNA-directed RNA polymerase specialized sigma24 family protein
MSERDRSWFDEMYNGHYPDIVRYGVRRLAEVDASADLAQEVFVVAWLRRDQVPDNSLPWLYGVARRLLANHRRAQRRWRRWPTWLRPWSSYPTSTRRSSA